MLLDISGKTFSSLGNPQDADAMAFISAAGISDTTQITAIDNLVKNLKTANIWTKMQLIYPFVGGTATTHKFNLKDPRNLDAAYRLGFSGGGWTHTSGGIQGNGSTSYANTFLNDATAMTLNSAHISIYSRTEFNGFNNGAGGNYFSGGCSIGVNQQISAIDYGTFLYPRFTNILYGGNQGIFTGVTNTSSLGFFVNNRINSTQVRASINGSISAYTTSAITKINANYFIGALNNVTLGATGSWFSPRQYAFASIGSGLTDSEAFQFNTIVEAYQTSLGRQVITSTTISRPTQFNIPTVIYQPPQILGTGMTIWYDFNDTSTLYTDSAATTNVTNTGDYILYVKNKATDRPNYDLRKPVPSNLPLSAYSATTNSVLIFKKSALNTNKNSENIYHNGTISGVLNPITSISAYPTTGKSAFTWSGVMKVTPGATVLTAFGLASFQGRFTLTFTNSTNTSITIGLTSGFVNYIVSMPCNLTNSNGYFYFTMTVDQNKNSIYYLNNRTLATTGLTTVIQYPLISLTSQVCTPHYAQGGSNSLRSNLGMEITEYIFNDSEVLTPDQVNKLHNYYRVKYNLPFF